MRISQWSREDAFFCDPPHRQDSFSGLTNQVVQLHQINPLTSPIKNATANQSVI